MIYYCFSCEAASALDTATFVQLETAMGNNVNARDCFVLSEIAATVTVTGPPRGLLLFRV
jgi:hypothetical protein